jgi:hypothetical protein
MSRLAPTAAASEAAGWTERQRCLSPCPADSTRLIPFRYGCYGVRVAAPQRSGRIFLAGEMTDCCGAGTALYPKGSVAHEPGLPGPHSGSPCAPAQTPWEQAPHGGLKYASPWPPAWIVSAIDGLATGSSVGGYVAWRLASSRRSPCSVHRLASPGTDLPSALLRVLLILGCLGSRRSLMIGAPVWFGNSTSVAYHSRLGNGRAGWQPSRFLTDRAEAERDFAWAKRLGSTITGQSNAVMKLRVPAAQAPEKPTPWPARS